MLLRREGTAIDQLQYYDQLRATRVDPQDLREQDADRRGIRSRLEDAVAQVAGKRGFTADFKIRLERAGYRLRPSEFMYLHLLGVAIVGVLVSLRLASR